MNTRQVDAARPGQTLWDDQVKGLHLRAFPTSKAFYLKYKTKAGTQRRPKLGAYPTISLATARELARGKLAVVLAGGDPDAPAAVERTFADLVAHWVEAHLVRLEPKTQIEYRAIVGLPCAPRRPGNYKPRTVPTLLDVFGKKPLRAITEAECRAYHESMWRAPFSANRRLEILRGIFNKAEDWGWIPRHSSPVHVTYNPEPERERYPDVEEAARLFATLDAMRQENPWFWAYIWGLCLTGCRPVELRSAKWAWITPKGLELPKAKRRPKGRLVALSEASRAILARIPPILGSPWLFPGIRPSEGPHQGFVNQWRQLRKEAGLPGLQMRDLRRYFGSLALSGGQTLEGVGQLLGHRQAQTTKRYAHLMRDAKVKAVENVAAQLSGMKGAQSA